MPLTEKQMAEIAQEIIKAEKNAKAITNVIDRFPEMTIDEAYAIQMQLVKAKVQSGELIVGRKIGLCSKANQAMFGVDEPIYGQMFASAVVPVGDPISVSRLIRPVIEGEICFVLGKDLKGPGADLGKVLSAVAGVMPAIEIADCRYTEIKKKPQPFLCENSGAAKVAFSGKLTPIDDIDLRLVGMMLEKNGEVIATGAGAAVLGHPAMPIVHLVNKLAQFGMGLSAGEFIISGTPHAAVLAQAGDSFCVTWDRLGSVSIRFVK